MQQQRVSGNIRDLRLVSQRLDCVSLGAACGRGLDVNSLLFTFGVENPCWILLCFRQARRQALKLTYCSKARSPAERQRKMT